MFSNRSQFENEINAYTAALEAERARGSALLDLAVSNPTHCGFTTAQCDFKTLATSEELRNYAPTPHGSPATRAAIVNYYATHHRVDVSPDALTLASGTSEAYRLLFELLCDVGDEILAPSPGYPLLDLLAKSSGVDVVHYALRFDAERGMDVHPARQLPTEVATHAASRWRIDLRDLERKMSPRTRVLVLISPNNPTGHVIDEEEIAQIVALCAKHDLALIVDEVFADYTKLRSHHPMLLERTCDVLTFLLNGVSKSVGLPQLKLSWILASGPTERVVEARRRIEFLTDSLLSVSTFAQLAASSALANAGIFHAQVRERIERNREFLVATFGATQFEILPSDGGWYQVLRVPNELAGEAGAIRCLREASVILLPGYFFDFDDDRDLVISLIAMEAEFREGITRLVRLGNS